MPYLHAVVLETLRLYPPATGMGRTTLKAMTLKGMPIPAGVTVFVDGRAIMRHPQHYDDPERFDPERFLVRDEAGTITDVLPRPKSRDGPVRRPGVRMVDRMAYLPFSAGIRNCPGQHYALTAVRMIMATLLSRYEFVFRPGQNFTEGIVIASEPKYGVWGTLLPRNKSL